MIFEDSLYSQLNFRTAWGAIMAVTIFYRWGNWGSVQWSHLSKAPHPKSMQELTYGGWQGFLGLLSRVLSSVHHNCLFFCPHPLIKHKSLLPNTDISCLMEFSSRERTKPLGGQDSSISLYPLSWHWRCPWSLAIIHQEKGSSEK